MFKGYPFALDLRLSQRGEFRAKRADLGMFRLDQQALPGDALAGLNIQHTHADLDDLGGLSGGRLAFPTRRFYVNDDESV
jgi:hypothetical protein